MSVAIAVKGFLSIFHASVLSSAICFVASVPAFSVYKSIIERKKKYIYIYINNKDIYIRYILLFFYIYLANLLL